MAISRRRLRFRLRFVFGLAALAAVMLLVPAAYAAPPKQPPTTPAGDQYNPKTVTYVTVNAARIGKCKLAVVRLYVPKVKKCKTKACRAAALKAQTTAKRRCDRIGQAVTKKAAPKRKTTVIKPKVVITTP